METLFFDYSSYGIPISLPTPDNSSSNKSATHEYMADWTPNQEPVAPRQANPYLADWK